MLNLDTFGWNLGVEKCFVEFKRIPTTEELEKLEKIVNEAIFSNLGVSVEAVEMKEAPESLPEDLKIEANKGIVRLVKIDSFPPNAWYIYS
jgi:alanyl-tRNA synthetase